MFYDSIALFGIAWFGYFINNNKVNNPMVILIFISYLFFATNYSDFGLDLSFDIFRSLHRSIGIICILIFLTQVAKKRINIFHDWTTRALLLFICILLLSYIGNDIYLSHYIHYLRNFVFITFIVLFLYYQLDDNAKIDELFKSIGLSSVLLSIFIIIEIFSEGWGVRFTLFYSNSNYLAVALLPGFTVLILSKIRKFEFLSLLPLISIFASGSRATELAALFILILFIIENFKIFNKKYFVFSLAIIISTFVIFFDNIVVKTKIDGTRIAISKIVLNIYQEHPINGIGYGQFRTKYHQYIDEEILALNNTEINDGFKSFDTSISEEDLNFKGIERNLEKMTHSDLFTVVAELGSFGIIFLILLFFKIYVELKKLLLHSKKHFFTSAGLIGGSLIFSLLHNNMTSFIFWFVLFIPILMNKNYERNL